MFKNLVTGLALSTALTGGALALYATTASAASNPTGVTTLGAPSDWCPPHKCPPRKKVEIKDNEIKDNKVKDNQVGNLNWDGDVWQYVSQNNSNNEGTGGYGNGYGKGHDGDDGKVTQINSVIAGNGNNVGKDNEVEIEKKDDGKKHDWPQMAMTAE
ncbi:hypothetical protein Pth03_48690 [Planotetraspora thailandica]|uniref:Secreted protein n=1 Tax=Planotetraspora thailandica TaxID=487172 RepID=A0A8J3XXT2_9ACTN|nr:hypothetical protein [Planotetraspora thailandica]GII56480.1 hypothetical protein Pth03_48690 [Planotetraspora thailandica]